MSEGNRPSVIPFQRDEVSKAIRDILKALPDAIAAQHCIAQVTRARYRALREQGFTEAQALELCK